MVQTRSLRLSSTFSWLQPSSKLNCSPTSNLFPCSHPSLHIWSLFTTLSSTLISTFVSLLYFKIRLDIAAQLPGLLYILLSSHQSATVVSLQCLACSAVEAPTRMPSSLCSQTQKLIPELCLMKLKEILETIRAIILHSVSW